MMKLGVNTVDLFSGDHLILNALPELDDLALVQHVQRLRGELGVDLVELPANMLVVCPHLFTERTIQALGEYQQSSGVGYTVHLPFRGLDLSSLAQPVWEASIAAYREIITRLEAELQVEHYVLHLTESMIKQVEGKAHLDWELREKLFEVMYARAESGLEKILETAPKDKVLVENIKSGWKEPFALARKLGMGVCCDFGHLLLEGADPRVVVEQNRDLIREFHFHGVVERQLDNGRTALQDHQAVDRGVFALEEALELLLADSFSGVLMIEVGRWEAAEASVRAVKAYLNKRINN